jgi:hypothetical protein
MTDHSQIERELMFLKATLEGDLLPEWPENERSVLRRMIKEDYTRKFASHSDAYVGAGAPDSDIDKQADQDRAVNLQPDPTPENGRFIVLGASQELPAVLSCVSQLKMTYEETSFGKNLIGHRILWEHGDMATTLWLCCAVSQRVDALSNLINTLSERFSPISIILTGMMGGIPNKIGFLDVVIPTAIYDGRVVGTKAKKIILEPEPGLVHPAIHSIANNIPEFLLGESAIEVKKNKKSLTVAAKMDDISHSLFRALISPDKENIVAFEMEAQAVANANFFQQLSGGNTVLGVVKSVADFGGMESGQSEEEIDLVKSNISYIDTDGEFDPIENKKVKSKLQYEATKRALFVAAEISRRFEPS